MMSIRRRSLCRVRRGIGIRTRTMVPLGVARPITTRPPQLAGAFLHAEQSEPPFRPRRLSPTFRGRCPHFEFRRRLGRC